MNLRTLRRLITVVLAVATISACTAAPGADQPDGLSGWRSQFTWLEPARVPRRTPIQAVGGTLDLDAFAGQLVVLNFWASWCAPCIKELPSLDRLQASLGNSGIQVVAVSIDRAGIPAVEKFYRRLGIGHLAIYADPENRTGHLDRANAARAPFALYRMPITYIIAPDGRSVGYLEGAADWDSPEAIAFLRALARRDATVSSANRTHVRRSITSN